MCKVKPRKELQTDDVAHQGYERTEVQITEQKRPLDQKASPALSVAEELQAGLKREKERLMRNGNSSHRLPMGLKKVGDE